MHMKRQIGVLGLTFIAISGMLGSGWLFAPLLAAQQAGPIVLLSWIIGGLSILIIALCYAEISAILPVAGGIARLPVFSHGKMTAMVLGWTAWLGYNMAAPLETEVLLQYLVVVWPWIEKSESGGLTWQGNIVAIVIMALFMIINLVGVRLFSATNTIITWFKILVPIIISVVLITSLFNSSNFTNVHSGGIAPYGLRGMFSAIAGGGIAFAFIGFRHAVDMAGEAKKPQRTIPIALILSVIISLAVYLLLQTAFIGSLTAQDLAAGWHNLQTPAQLGPLAAAVFILGWTWLIATLYTGVLVGPLGEALVATGSTARIGYALANTGLLPKIMLTISRRHVPWVALVVGFIINIAVVLFMSFEHTLLLNSATITLSFIAGPLCCYSYRALRPGRPDRFFRVPALAILARLGFIFATAVTYFSGWYTVRILMVCIVFGGLIFLLRFSYSARLRQTLDLANALWLLPYLLGLAGISYIGQYGGQQWLPFGWDLLVVALFALVLFEWAHASRLSRQQAIFYRRQWRSESQGNKG